MNAGTSAQISALPGTEALTTDVLQSLTYGNGFVFWKNFTQDNELYQWRWGSPEERPTLAAAMTEVICSKEGTHSRPNVLSGSFSFYSGFSCTKNGYNED